MSVPDDDPILLGWEEWVSLPALGLPALKAKIDTGAKTSALHAFDIEPFGPADRPMVRFAIPPIVNRDDLVVACSAPVVDRREVISSNGERELRYVIATRISVGGRSWPIELTLTNRETMAYRMLLGRQAIGPDLRVDPSSSFHQPVLGYGVYKGLKAPKQEPRALRLALLTRGPANTSSRLLREAAETAGHTIEIIDPARCYMSIDALVPRVHYDGRPLPHFDAVIPRIGASLTTYGTTVVRQFEMIGSYCVAPAGAIAASRDKFLAYQLLARSRVDMPATAFAQAPSDTASVIELVGAAPWVVKLTQAAGNAGNVRAGTRSAAAAVIDAFQRLDADFLVQKSVEGPDVEGLRCIVVGGRVVAARTFRLGDDDGQDDGASRSRDVKPRREERQVAVRAARAIGLAVAGVDLVRTPDGPKVIEITHTPALSGFELIPTKARREAGSSGGAPTTVAGAIVHHIADHVGTLVKRR